MILYVGARKEPKVTHSLVTFALESERLDVWLVISILEPGRLDTWAVVQ